MRLIGAWTFVAASLVWALFGSIAAAVTAEEIAVSERTEVKLHADRLAAAPGDTITLLLEQNITEGWHTYWVNSGDSGMKTEIAWTAPDGVSFSEIAWPAPHRAPFGPLMNYGFKNEALLRVTAEVPRDWRVGEPLEVSAHARWLVCSDICVPEEQTFALTIPVEQTARPDPAVARLLARAAASEPAPLATQGAYQTSEGKVRLRFAPPIAASALIEDVYFFADAFGLVEHAEPQRYQVDSGGVTLETVSGGEAVTGALGGVLEVTARPAAGEEPITIAYAVSAQAGVVAPLSVAAAGAGAGAAQLGGSVLLALAFAFLGGLILNVMPCVFPVLALKAFALAKHADQDDPDVEPGAPLREGLGYMAGVLVTFFAFAGALIALRAGGEVVGWGFQLQSPAVIAALAAVLFLVGLNLSGVFDVAFQITGGRAGDALAGQGGVAGSFFTGVLAALVASPCTAPFMGAALGLALTRPPVEAFLIFGALGLGFAAPITLLSASPSLGRLLPRPGPWMERFKQLLAFPMYLAAAWLLWVLGGQAGVDAMFAALAGLVLLALGVWVWREAARSGAIRGRWSRRVAACAAALAIGGGLGGLALASGALEVGGRAVAAVDYDPAALESLRAEGRAVFVNITADWCVSCKVNERLVLSGDSFRGALAQADAVYMRGDWTSPDPQIAAFLESHGVSSIPLYAVYPADGGAPAQLPPLLTDGIVSDALAAAK